MLLLLMCMYCHNFATVELETRELGESVSVSRDEGVAECCTALEKMPQRRNSMSVESK